MSEYIEREAANNALLEAIRVFPSSFYNGIYNGIEVARTVIINRIPAADVRPVVRGRWVTAQDKGDCCYRCSKCGFMRDAYLLDIANFCPSCGADMRKEDAQ